MDSLQFDGYTSYSDSSTPRTPSPQDVHFIHSPHYKPTLDIEPRIYGEHGTDPAAEDGIVPIVPGDAPYWNGSAHPPPHFSYNSSRGSLLQELYDHDIAEQHTHSYMEQSAEPSFHGAENWSPQQTSQLQEHQRRHPDYTMVRRATFPYVRQDRGDAVPMQSYPPFIQHHQQDNFHSFSARPDNVYGSSLSLSSEPSEGFVNPHSQPYHDYDDNPSIKLEDNGSMMVPSQTGFYRPQSASPLHNGMTMSYLSPHTGLPVQHTDDAASKETQYLRRRCFNCHTTEPPSWRRSTLNPGKIVCNKCGLYERTHLRPRPLRFDELRAGNKARKASKGTVSPKATKIGLVKKEPREFGLVRRSSVSSSSSVHSGSGASDWDDNGVFLKPTFSHASH
jgi:GATA-binding protein